MFLNFFILFSCSAATETLMIWEANTIHAVRVPSLSGCRCEI